MAGGGSDLRWVEYDGVLARATERAIGLRGHEGEGVELWLPRSQVKRITYKMGGDSFEVRPAAAIEAIEIPWWLAKQNGLVK